MVAPAAAPPTARPDQALSALAEIMGPLIRQQEAQRYGIGLAHDASGTPTAVYSHGPGGLLTFPGVDPAAFQTIMGAESMLGQLATSPSLYTNPTYYTITGVQGDSGSEKEDVCDNAPTAGLLKACLTTSVFGRYERATSEMEINRLGQRVDRADPMDLSLVGNPLAQNVFAVGPESVGFPGDLLTNEVGRRFWERNVSFHRLLSQQLWVGNPTNNAVGGGYKELTGFDQLITTGYTDAETGTVCPSVDSYIRDLNYLRVDGNCDRMVIEVTNAFYQIRDRAIRMGVTPVRWLLAMRPQLFYALTACWPCSYLTDKCEMAGQERIFVTGNEQIRMRDEMRAGKYLIIDGIRVDVVTDDGIAEDADIDNANVPAGCFATDIYFIPMSVVGGRAVTFLEFFQYNNPSILDALGNLILGRIEGAFLTWPRQLNQCIVWQSKIEPRLVMRTPWLAARLQNVLYCPIQHTRDTFPDRPYHVDGGRTKRDGPSYFSPWQV